MPYATEQCDPKCLPLGPLPCLGHHDEGEVVVGSGERVDEADGGCGPHEKEYALVQVRYLLQRLEPCLQLLRAGAGLPHRP